jgi:hypothetical protein
VHSVLHRHCCLEMHVTAGCSPLRAFPFPSSPHLFTPRTNESAQTRGIILCLVAGSPAASGAIFVGEIFAVIGTALMDKILQSVAAYHRSLIDFDWQDAGQSDAVYEYVSLGKYLMIHPAASPLISGCLCINILSV